MWKSIYKSIVVTAVLCFVLCGVYPAMVTLISNIAFKDKAHGSLIYNGDTVIGSKLIGQSFTRPEYFHGRPSAAGANGYDAASSSGSNLGPTSKKLAERLQADMENVLKENPKLKKGEIPVDMITTSGSGLDPHISPESAFAQVDRVAKARNMDPDQIRNVVTSMIENRELGFLGEKRVNVLLLNKALDEIKH